MEEVYRYSDCKCYSCCLLLNFLDIVNAAAKKGNFILLALGLNK